MAYIHNDNMCDIAQAMNETAAVLQLLSARHALSKAAPAPPVLLTDGVLYRLIFFDESVSNNSVIHVYRWLEDQRSVACHFLRKLLQKFCEDRRAQAAAGLASLYSRNLGGGGSGEGGDGGAGGTERGTGGSGYSEHLGLEGPASSSTAATGATGSGTLPAVPQAAALSKWDADLKEAEWMDLMRAARSSAFVRQRLGPPPCAWSSVPDEFRAQLLRSTAVERG